MFLFFSFWTRQQNSRLQWGKCCQTLRLTMTLWCLSLKPTSEFSGEIELNQYPYTDTSSVLLKKTNKDQQFSWDLKGSGVFSGVCWEDILWPWCWKREENTCSGTRMSSCIWPKIWAFDCFLPSTPAVAYLIPGWVGTQTGESEFGHLTLLIGINTVATVSEYTFNDWIVFIFTVP